MRSYTVTTLSTTDLKEGWKSDTRYCASFSSEVFGASTVSTARVGSTILSTIPDEFVMSL